MTFSRFVTVATLAALATSPARADVRAVEREGFVIVIERELPAAPDAVFAALTRPAEWWDSAHSWSGDARNLSLDPRAGGCWCETLPHNGSVEHGRVISYNPVTRQMVMDSLLGPLQSIGQSGRLIWAVDALEGGSSRIRWTYRVAMLPSGNPAQDATLAAAVDGVLRAQVARLSVRLVNASDAEPRP